MAIYARDHIKFDRLLRRKHTPRNDSEWLPFGLLFFLILYGIIQEDKLIELGGQVRQKFKTGFTPLNSGTPTAKRRYLTGFTLIELLVVVAIIGILATIIILNLTGAKNRSRYARVVSDMTNIATAAKVYATQNNNNYPINGAGYEGVYGLFPGIDSWPTPPCSGYGYWFYNANGGLAVIYYKSGEDIPAASKYKLVLQNCAQLEAVATSIYDVTDKKITCHE